MAEALWVEDIRERTFTERLVVGARMAQATEWDGDKLPDVDTALDLFAKWLAENDSTNDLSPEDEQRLAVGLGKRR